MPDSRRHDFDIDAGVTYLNGAAESPLPRAARTAVDEAWRLQATPSRMPFEALFSYADAIRERAARLLGYPAHEIAVTTSTGAGMMLVAQGIRWQPGDRLLLGPDEFPSNAYPWFAVEERGVRVERIGRPGRPLTPEDLEAALASGGRVRALSLAAVHYPTGDLHPLEPLAALLHARGALLVVDASQAAGAIAIDWRASGVDVMAASGYKWLLGPFGTGLLCVRDEVRESLVNVNGNWLSVEGARDMARIMTDYPRTYERHARVFDAGEVGSYFNISAFRAGLDLLIDVGVAAAEAHHRRLQDRAVAALGDVPLVPVTALDRPHRGPMVMFEGRDGLDLARLHADLASRHISLSLRVGRLRLSPGIWNEASDVDAFTNAVRGMVRPAVR
jgi:selenocysteine lyase/cysteine desulfurase